MANGPGRALNADTSYAGDYPTYASDSTSKFTPLIFSKKMLRNFYQTTAFNQIANTEYQGEIKANGDKVLIRKTPVISVTAYTVGKDLVYEVPEIANTELNIDKAYSWSFRIDDIDEVQSDLDLMNKFAADAGERLKIQIDTECFDYIATLPSADNKGDTAGALSNNINLGKATAPVSITSDNATELIVDVNTVLDEANIPSENRWIVLPAWYVSMLKKGDLKSADITGDGTGVIRSGVVGMVN